MTGERSPRPPLRDVLRDASRTAHSCLDATLGDHLLGADGYPDLLRLLQAFHATADPLLEQWVRTSSTAPQVVAPLRAGAFASDLAVLGHSTGAPLALAGLSRRPDGCVTDPAGLALLYVVAGSSIGARLILRSLAGNIPHAARHGLADCASAGSIELWRRTLVVLSVPVDPSVAAQAAAACQLIFRQLLVRPRRRGE